MRVRIRVPAPWIGGANRKGIIGKPIMECYGLSDPGRLRANNEDHFLLAPDLGLFIVADGMGGAQAGEHASQIAVETAAQSLRSQPPAARDLKVAFQSANERVRQAAAADARMEGMGTTLVAVLLTADGMQVASVGDSRCYIHENDELVIVTEDQTWVHEVGRRLGLDSESLKRHPMRNVLTMAIGVGPEIRIQTALLKPAPGTTVLLSSDGLHGVVSEDEIARVVGEPGPLAGKCRRLIEAANAAGGPDNITAVMLRVPAV